MKKRSKEKKEKRSIETDLNRSANCTDTIKSDVLGSYTGTCVDGETPVQDADDL